MLLLGLLLSIPARAQLSSTPQEKFWTTDGTVYSMLETNGAIYIGGDFSYVGPNNGSGAVTPTNSTFPYVGWPGVDGDVYAATADGSGGWYIGGSFISVGDVVRTNLAHILSTQIVDPVWNPAANGPVYALSVVGSNVIIGGSFTAINGLGRSRLASVNAVTGLPTAWMPEANSTVNAVQPYTSLIFIPPFFIIPYTTVFVGGSFTDIGGQTRNRLAQLDPFVNTNNATSWDPNLNSTVNALSLSGSTLYAGGFFTTVGTSNRNYLAAISTSSGLVTPWNPKPNSSVYALAATTTNVFVGGAFTTIGGSNRTYLAALASGVNTNMATLWNPGPNNTVRALAIINDLVWAAGFFDNVGSAPALGYCRIFISTGGPVYTTGAGGVGRALAVSGSRMYVGGSIRTGGQVQNNVAKLDANTGALITSWNPNVKGSSVRALAFSGTNLYVGGYFTNAGGFVRTNLAAISTNGVVNSTWDPAPNSTVYALAISGGTVFLGGSFNVIDGVTRKGLASVGTATGTVTTWDPSATKSGGTAYIYSLLTSGSTVYVGGYFTDIGGANRNYIARIDATTGVASSWNPNADYSVYALALSGGTLYAGGGFTTIGNSNRNYLAAIDTGKIAAVTAWNPNLDDWPLSLQLDGSTLYAGGYFTTVSGYDKNYAAGISTNIPTKGGYATSWKPQPDGIVYSVGNLSTGVGIGGSFARLGSNARQRRGFAAFGDGAPNITSNPSSLAVISGNDAAFSASVSGLIPRSYQWRFNGANITDATNLSLTVSNVQPVNAGGYSLFVTNTAGSALSAIANLTVILQPPSIVTQPTNVIAVLGTNVSFSVEADGSRPFSYEWRLNGIAITGATNSTYNITGADPSDEGIYTVRVTSIAGSIFSSPAVLTLLYPPKIVTPPASQNIGVGNTLNLTVTVQGTAPFSYQWLKTSTPIAGATSDTYSIINAQTIDSGPYRVTVSNPYGTVTSAVANVSVIVGLVAPSIPYPIPGQIVPPGSNVTFSPYIIGSSPLIYQWRLNNSDLPGATNATITITNAQLVNVGNYSLVATNLGGSATSSNAYLGVIPFQVESRVRDDFQVTDGQVYSVLVTNGVIYLGGNFNHIRPNGGRGLLIDSDTGTANTAFPQVVGDIKAVVDDGAGGWFVGGEFYAIGGVARIHLAHIKSDLSVDPLWNASIPTNNSTYYFVSALTRVGQTLYVGGNFYNIGGQNRQSLAALDTVTALATSWNPSPSGTVYALASARNSIYVGGYFTSIGGASRTNLAEIKISNGQASSYNLSCSGGVFALATSCCNLYVGGVFTNIGGFSRTYFAGINMDTRTILPWTANANSTIYALATSDDTVFLGGYFSAIGGQSRSRLAAVNGLTGEIQPWAPVANDVVKAITTFGNTVYVGGEFSTIDSLTRDRIAAIDGASGELLEWAPSTSGNVYALGVSDTAVLAGGNVSYGSAVRNNAAALDAATGQILPWNPNASSDVRALAMMGTNIYLAGYFSTIGASNRFALAAVDPTNGLARDWNPAPSSSVYAMVASGTNLYVGGFFTSIGGQSRNRLAALDPDTGLARSWNPNADNYVTLLTAAGSNVYAFGYFTNIGGLGRPKLAAIDINTGAPRTNWNVPVATNAYIYFIDATTNTLYIGGSFTNIGGQSRRYLAALNSTNGAATAWDPNPNSIPTAIARSTNQVYIGGYFSSIGGQSRRYVAALDYVSGLATPWNPGITDYISVMQVANDNLYLGGALDSLGGSYHPYIAVFPPVGTPLITQQPQGGQLLPGNSFMFSVTATGKTNLFYQWFKNGQSLATATNSTFTIVSPIVADSGKYSVLVTNSIGRVLGSEAELVVINPVAILAQPYYKVDPRGNYTLLIGVTGSPKPTVQWLLNGEKVRGANSSKFFIGGNPTNSGIYSALVGNLGNYILSAPLEIAIAANALPLADIFNSSSTITSISGVGAGSNTGATREAGEPLHFNKTGSNSVWLQWIAPADGIATFHTRGSSIDTLLGVYTGVNVGALTKVVSDDDRARFGASHVSFNAVAGAKYQIAIDGFAGETGRVVLSWSLDTTKSDFPRFVTPPLDQTAAPGQNVSFSVVMNSPSPVTYQWFLNRCEILVGETNATLNITNVTLASVGLYSVRVANDTTDQPVESLPGRLELGPDPTQFSQDKFQDLFDPSGSSGSPGLSGLTPKKSAYTSVSSGVLGTQVLNNFGSSTQSGEPLNCGAVGGASRWFTLRPTTNGTLIVDTIGSDIDTLLAAYRGPSLFTLTNIACDDNSAPDGIRSRIQISVTKNVDYYIAVDGVGGAQGNISMNWLLGNSPAITLSPTNRVVTKGNTNAFVASASGSPVPVLQWGFNGGALTAATNGTLVLSNVQPANAGGYFLVASNAFGSVTSIVATLTVREPMQLSGTNFLGVANNQFVFRILNVTNMPKLVVEASTNLTAWSPIATNTPAKDFFDFTNSIPINVPYRFYRSKEQ